jgi:hypothetical protein
VEIKPIPVRFLSLHSQVRPDKLPTLSAARSYPDLRPGDAVEVDILQNPATGERIYDVLTAGLETPSAADGRRAPGERLSLEDARMAVNGKTVVERQESRQTWMRCGALMIHLPGRGEFYFSLTPPAGLPFRPAAWVDRATLRFHAGPDLVEVTGRSNILPRSLFATLWMHHISSTPDRGYEFHCGDDAQSVIELYRKKDD